MQTSVAFSPSHCMSSCIASITPDTCWQSIHGNIAGSPVELLPAHVSRGFLLAWDVELAHAQLSPDILVAANCPSSQRHVFDECIAQLHLCDTQVL